MDNYIVSARKYRPATFDSVVGQLSLTTTLKNSIASKRLAHAYLFCGPRGVGKTTCARIFAKTINCMHPKDSGEACEECESCRAFNEQRSLNIHELDAASNNSVEDIRQLIDQVSIPPQIGRYKVYIIDEVHMLSTAAFNAFLKTLEEPPAHAIFILATTEKHKLLPTILSRCQIYDFSRITLHDIVGHLQHVAEQEGITYEPAALNVIAQKADGGMRDALSIFDQVASFCQGHITYAQTIADLNVLDYDYYFKVVDEMLACHVPTLMLILNDVLSKGFEGNNFVRGLNQHFRNLLMSRDAETTKLIETSDDIRQRYAEQAQRCTPRFLYAAIRKCTDCDLNYRVSQNRRLLVELTLIEVEQLCEDAASPTGGLGPAQKLFPVFQTASAQRGNGSPTTSTIPTPASTPSAAQSTASVAVPMGTAQAAQGSAIPQPHPQSASSPAPATPSAAISSAVGKAAPKPAASVQRARGFSIRAVERAEEEGENAHTVAEPDVSLGKPQEPFTQPALVTAWRTFTQTLAAEDAAMRGRMENMEPQLSPDGHTFEIVADNEVVERQFADMQPRILQSLRHQLHNHQVAMRIRIREKKEQPVIYNKREQLHIMAEENPALKMLAREFGLEME